MRLDCRGISGFVLANDMVLILEKPQLGHAPDNATSGAVGAKLHMHLKHLEFVADLPTRHCPVITRAPRCRGSLVAGGLFAGLGTGSWRSKGGGIESMDWKELLKVWA